MLASAVAWLALCGPAIADDPRFSTPAGADEVLEARDVPVALRYDADRWAVAPQPSDFRLLARVTHKDGAVSGAFVYRDEPASEEAVRRRAREELAMFNTHEVDGFTRRVVNGTPVLFLEATGTTGDGSEIVVRSYYWTGAAGVVDYGLIAPREVFDRHRAAMMDLLNGLEISAGTSSD